jgi:hypothetical protein
LSNQSEMLLLVWAALSRAEITCTLLGDLMMVSEGEPSETGVAQCLLEQTAEAGIKQMEVGEGVEVIPERACEQWRTLASVTITSNALRSIGQGAFAGCTGLGSVSFPQESSLESLGESCFEGCTSLSDIQNLGGSLQTIGGACFKGCAALTDFVIPGSVTELPDEVFQGCGFQEITLPEGMTTIGARAFADCPVLAKVICDGNAVFHARSFEGTARLTTITYSNAESDPNSACRAVASFPPEVVTIEVAGEVITCPVFSFTSAGSISPVSPSSEGPEPPSGISGSQSPGSVPTAASLPSGASVQTQSGTGTEPGPNPPTGGDPGSPSGAGGDESKSSSNKGMIIGVSVAAAVVVIGGAIGIFMFIRWWRGRSRREDPHDYLEKDEELIEEAGEVGYDGEMGDDGDNQPAADDGDGEDFGFG